ncbi:MAG: protein kinase, partial [Dehalococcoidia bacterium]|nr:protein kinase [Dehalococcoidia bacterium]
MATRSTATGRTVEVGGYRPIAQITSSRVASLYKAIALDSTRTVALRAGRASQTDAINPTALDNMVRSARVMMRINHPNIARVFGTGTDGGWHFVATNWVEQNLADALSGSDPVTIREAAAFALSIARGLAAAHGTGLIHSALTPGNILITAREVPQITDFGGMALSGPEKRASYVSPEQANGQQPGPRSDLYAFGCVLYELIAGAPPFKGFDPASVRKKHVREIPIPLEEIRLGVPGALSALVLSCLEKDSRNRPRTIDNVVDDLNDIVIDMKNTGRPGGSSGLIAENPDGVVVTETRRRTGPRSRPEQASGTWGFGPAMNEARAEHASLTLNDGRILATGGRGGVSSCDIYDPVSGKWTSTGAMSTARSWHNATLLGDGRVLVSGGYTDDSPVASAEIFSPGDDLWTELPRMQEARSEHTSEVLDDGRV